MKLTRAQRDILWSDFRADDSGRATALKTRDKLAALRTLAQMPHVGLLPAAGAQVTIDARQQTAVTVYDQLTADELRRAIAAEESRMRLLTDVGQGGA